MNKEENKVFWDRIASDTIWYTRV